MKKLKTFYECGQCGAQSPVWQGRCTTCNEWNTLVEQEKISTKKTTIHTEIPQKLEDISLNDDICTPSGIEELDHVLGKGFVSGSVLLLGGEPGIGKSTLSLQIAQNMGHKGHKVLYISGEESLKQIASRAKRIGSLTDTVWVVNETDLEGILHLLETHSPDFVMFDSIQVFESSEIPGTAGSVTQVRYCAGKCIQWIKKHQKIGIVIGHITKEGQLAGPKVLEHMVDVILYLEGERTNRYRLLRSYKNRYFNTQEMGVFEMTATGLDSVKEAVDFFLQDKDNEQIGSVIAPVIEGSRIFLVEVQALVVHSGYGMAKRNIVGANVHRVHLMIAALDKLLGIKCAQHDIFLTIMGGLKVDEPALDLAVIAAILSSYYNKNIPKSTAFFGEIGLTGEIRSTPLARKRLYELSRLGFKQCVCSQQSKEAFKSQTMDVATIGHIQELLRILNMSHVKTSTR